ncbi:hypothetical protein OG986_23170 [Streptomyces cellulosae]|uniref:hypothetical protein n=1 Tax=Streptomyces sp. Akac8 TaxID=2563106 RepID=UPI00109EDC6F|nr:hypothetical protein E7X38_21155 [Streptomyces sp. Akac8]
MPADEVTHGADVEASRVRTGPRHAAPKKPLFTRFHMPAGKAIAIAAMPTAVLMGMGFTPTLAQADDQPSSRSLTADEFKECLEAIEKAEEAEKGDASASPTPSAGESASEDEKEPSADPTTAPAQEAPEEDADKGSDSSPDSGSDDKAEPTPSPSASAGGQAADTAPAPSPSETDKNLLEEIGDAIKDVFTPGGAASETPSPEPSPSASSSAPAGEADEKDEKASQKPAEKPAGDILGKVGDAAQDATEQAEEAVKEETKEPEATASPSVSESGMALEDCPVATDDEGGVDNKVPLPDDPWFLNASSLLLKGADYKGVVEVRTANGTKKKVLKYVVSDGTDIGDLHQTVKDKQSGKTYHVQAAKGSTSTIRDGDTVMYTESISGNLLGLIPITFDPENPPPLNIPLIYFTKVTVQQAGQFGGTLHVPGLHQYVTD